MLNSPRFAILSLLVIIILLSLLSILFSTPYLAGFYFPEAVVKLFPLKSINAGMGNLAYALMLYGLYWRISSPRAGKALASLMIVVILAILAFTGVRFGQNFAITLYLFPLSVASLGALDLMNMSPKLIAAGGIVISIAGLVYLLLNPTGVNLMRFLVGVVFLLVALETIHKNKEGQIYEPAQV